MNRKLVPCRVATALAVCLLTVSLAIVQGVNAAPGDLDLSFGIGGVVTTHIMNIGHYQQPSAILVQPDGKILVSGQIDDYGGVVSFFIARYYSTGALDLTFGESGTIIAPSDYLSDFVGAGIALQPDGKIIAIGFTFNSTLEEGVVHRYNSNGTLDTSFGTDGRVVASRESHIEFKSVALQPDGKIVVIGASYIDNRTDFLVGRFNPDGSLDNSFGVGGMRTTRTGTDSEVMEVLAQPNGKIVAVGSIRSSAGDWDFGVLRYNPNGSLDNAFGAGGIVITSTVRQDVTRTAALHPDGKIVVAGIRYDTSGPSEFQTTIVRYNGDGSIDGSFAANGVFTTENSFFLGTRIALQPDGKIVAFGQATIGVGDLRTAIARLNPNGSLDAAFGTNGRAVMPPIIGSFPPSAGIVQPDGKILAVKSPAYKPYDIRIVRLRGDSAVIPTKFDFDGDARSDVSVFRPSDRVWYLNRSTARFSATQFGLSTDQIAPADYDGDGKTDISVYRDGTWFWLNSSDGVVRQAQWGFSSDTPLPADYTGDGRADLGVFRGGTWFIYDNATGASRSEHFGIATDQPVAADYDGDGRTDLAVYRDGTWYLNRSTQGFNAIQFGLPTDHPVVSDYDGDGKSDVAVYRDGMWYLLGSQTGFSSFQFGLATDIPVPADYDGDGKTDAAVYRNGFWYLRQSTSGFAATHFGLAADKPVPAAYVP